MNYTVTTKNFYSTKVINEKGSGIELSLQYDYIEEEDYHPRQRRHYNFNMPVGKQYQDPTKPIDISYRIFMHPADNLARWTSRESACSIVGEENIAAAETLLVDQEEIFWNKILEGRETKAWQLFKPYIEKTVKDYLSDFYVHDAYHLAHHPNESIMLLVRDSGTDIFERSRIAREKGYSKRDSWYQAIKEVQRQSYILVYNHKTGKVTRHQTYQTAEIELGL